MRTETGIFYLHVFGVYPRLPERVPTTDLNVHPRHVSDQIHAWIVDLRDDVSHQSPEWIVHLRDEEEGVDHIIHIHNLIRPRGKLNSQTGWVQGLGLFTSTRLRGRRGGLIHLPFRHLFERLKFVSERLHLLKHGSLEYTHLLL